jgi:hypothetical protein
LKKLRLPWRSFFKIEMSSLGGWAMRDIAQRKQKIIALLEESHQKMGEVVARADANQMIYANWRMKEVVDHLTGWDDASIASLESLLNYAELPTPARIGINEYNRRTVSEREALDYETSKREWEATRRQLIEMLRSFPEERFEEDFIFSWGYKGNLEQMLGVFIEHEAEHAHEISELLAAGAAKP